MRVWLYWGIGGESERSLCVVIFSYSDNSLVVGLDNCLWFYLRFGVSTLFSCVFDCVYLSSLVLLFPNSGIKSFSSVRYHNSLYALLLQLCLIFHIRKKKCDIVKVLKKGL